MGTESRGGGGGGGGVSAALVAVWVGVAVASAVKSRGSPTRPPALTPNVEGGGGTWKACAAGP